MKDLRLFCYGEQAYGSGWKGSEQWNEKGFSPADEGDNHDDVNLMDMELEPQIEDEIPSAADFLAGAFNISFATYEADLETSRKTTRSAEMSTLPFVNNVIQDGVEQKEDSMRPKQVSKPRIKLIANRLQTDMLKLERLWQETAQTISKLQGTPDSVKALR